MCIPHAGLYSEPSPGAPVRIKEQSRQGPTALLPPAGREGAADPTGLCSAPPSRVPTLGSTTPRRGEEAGEVNSYEPESFTLWLVPSGAGVPSEARG